MINRLKSFSFIIMSLMVFESFQAVDTKDHCMIEKSQASDKTELKQLLNEITPIYDELSKKVIMPAEGYLKYPYLIPAGFYKQMWDWDGFFMANFFISQGKPQYMKDWALNLIQGIDEKGYVSGCATTEGPRPIFGDFSMKPFLSQGVLFYSRAVNDYSWIKPFYSKLKLAVTYREKTQQDAPTGLFYWQIAMQSGADNNVAMNYFMDDKRSFLSCDASAFQLREYESMEIIARKLGFKADEKEYGDKAKRLRAAINKYLWCEQDSMYYNVDRETGDFYKRVSYSCFIPLISSVAPQEKGRAMITKYLINEKSMKSNYGYRSLSMQDPDYNNKNIIVPFSNWQGPIWPIANYLYSIALKNYGFNSELNWLASVMGKMMIKDYKKYGSLHESYDAEDGKPLAPADTYVDKNGKFVGFISWNLCVKNILDGAVNGKWMLLKTTEK